MTKHATYLSCDAVGCSATVARDLPERPTVSTMIAATRQGWDWYTWFNPATRHFCHKHVAQCDEERAEAERQWLAKVEREQLAKVADYSI
jgi:hypothetical protein